MNTNGLAMTEESDDTIPVSSDILQDFCRRRLTRMVHINPEAIRFDWRTVLQVLNERHADIVPGHGEVPSILNDPHHDQNLGTLITSVVAARRSGDSERECEILRRLNCEFGARLTFAADLPGQEGGRPCVIPKSSHNC